MLPSNAEFLQLQQVCAIEPVNYIPVAVREDRDACIEIFRQRMQRVRDAVDAGKATPVGQWLTDQLGFRRAKERIQKQREYVAVSDDEIIEIVRDGGSYWFRAFRDVHELSFLVGVATLVGEFIHDPNNVHEMNTCTKQQRAIELIEELLPLVHCIRKDKYFSQAQPHRILARLSRFEHELPDIIEALGHTAKAQCLYPVERIDDGARERKLIADLAALLHGIYRKVYPQAIAELISIEGVDSYVGERAIQKIAAKELERIRARQNTRFNIFEATRKRTPTHPANDNQALICA